ncbi:hypothetical protein R1flu_008020 [Riccia fluitans]|uniref:Uncharacterized protein n=1 Tax=Riccia fluitans TaxID=41844 RepID=A0ABD1YAQ9_9MARC
MEASAGHPRRRACHVFAPTDLALPSLAKSLPMRATFLPHRHVDFGRLRLHQRTVLSDPGLRKISPPLAKWLPRALSFFDASPMEANGSLPLAMALRSHWRMEITASPVEAKCLLATTRGP